jgi:hypothetical protein
MGGVRDYKYFEHKYWFLLRYLYTNTSITTRVSTEFYRYGILKEFLLPCFQAFLELALNSTELRKEKFQRNPRYSIYQIPNSCPPRVIHEQELKYLHVRKHFHIHVYENEFKHIQNMCYMYCQRGMIIST